MSTFEREVVKYYTRPRKIQHLVGRLPDGTRLPGGPYTLTQVAGAAGVLFVGAKTIDVWGIFGGLVDIGLLLAAAVAALFLLGRMRTGTRGPVAALMGGYSAIAAPRFGEMNGRAVAPKRPRHVTHRVVIRTPDLPGTIAIEPSPAPAATTVTARTSSAPLTGMQQALALAAQNSAESEVAA